MGFFAAAAIGGQAQPIPVQFARSLVGRSVTVCLDGVRVKTTFAGKLGFRDARGVWQSVCADVRAPLSAGTHFAVRPMSTSQAGGNVVLAGNIAARHLREATTADQCAGLQLAVWEAIEDGGASADFGSGRFQARATLAALALAQRYYQASGEPGDAIYLQAGGGPGQGEGGQSQIAVAVL